MEQGEQEKLLRENLKISRDNNKLLKKLHRHLIVGRIFRIFYWTVIIVSALGLFIFLQPYLDGLLNVYESFKDFVSDPRGSIIESF